MRARVKWKRIPFCWVLYQRFHCTLGTTGPTRFGSFCVCVCVCVSVCVCIVGSDMELTHLVSFSHVGNERMKVIDEKLRLIQEEREGIQVCKYIAVLSHTYSFLPPPPFLGTWPKLTEANSGAAHQAVQTRAAGGTFRPHPAVLRPCPTTH